ncbi:unnamed protein product [Mesocestoides corti]|uniref:Ras-associating domain-containing protein n=1 Tax=Mesocestoides corti TaxID=53468 RepID=A0A0R3U834_MESCO|nr:unnamed protein product [Mesocestoides corti]
MTNRSAPLTKELKVVVNGKPKDVCGVDEETTAEDVVDVLRESLKLKETFCLVASWRKNIIIFSSSERPLAFISRLRDSPENFQFFLRPTGLRRLSSRPISPNYQPRVHSPSKAPNALHNAATSYKVAEAFSGRSDLNTVDWIKMAEEEQQRQIQLQFEQSELLQKLQRVDVELETVRNKLQHLETKMASRLSCLFDTMDDALEKRRGVIASLSVSPGTPPPPPSNRTTPICEGVMI